MTSLSSFVSLLPTNISISISIILYQISCFIIKMILLRVLITNLFNPTGFIIIIKTKLVIQILIIKGKWIQGQDLQSPVTLKLTWQELFVDKQGWCIWESSILSSIWPEFNSWPQQPMWFEFVAGSLFCSEGFYSCYFFVERRPPPPHTPKVWVPDGNWTHDLPYTS